MKIIQFRPSPLSLALTSLFIAAPASSFAEQLPPLTVTGQPLGVSTTQEAWPADTSSPSADAGDWLSQQAGIDGNRMGGHGLDPVIRGLGQNRLNVLLDGAYVFGGCPNRMDPPTAYAPIHSYDRVLISKGVTTLRHGPGGSGGTVTFEREKPEFLPTDPAVRGQVGGSYASNGDTLKAWANLTTGGQQGYLRAFGEYSEADNYEDGAGREIWSGYETTQGGLILGWTPNQQTWLEATYEATRERDVKFAGAKMDSPESDNQTLGLRGEYDWSPLLTFSGNLHYSQIEHLMDNYSLRPDTTMKMRVPTTSDTLTGRLMAEYQLGPNQITGGLNLIQNERDATAYNGMGSETFFMWPQVSQSSLGAFAEVEHLIGVDQRAFAGIRADYTDSSTDRADQKPAMPANQPATIYKNAYGITGDLERNEWLTGAFVRFEKDLGTWQRAFVSASRSQRVGDATEMYMARPNWIGNHDLNPETSHQLDIGLIGKSPQLDYSAVAFSNWVSDYIYRDQGTIGTYSNADHYRNISAALYGIELETTLRYANNWETRGQLNAMRGDNRTDGGTLAQISPYNGQISQHWISESLEGLVRVRFAAEQDRLNTPAQEKATDAYAVLDLQLDWKPIQDLKLATGIDNLLDEEYANFINRNAAGSDPLNFGGTAYTETLTEPGRSIWISARYQF